jgi:heat-inducible transcriptional repressor
MVQPSSLNEREQHLLKTLIEDYIRSGQPVGSRNLARSAGLSLSAATVRNVMSDLEGLGLVTAPHTSAGRVPTVQGYRLFVDSLLNIRPLKVGEIEKMRFGLNAQHNTHGLIESASGLLSEITRMAGVVTLPRHDQVVLKQIEFLKLSEGRVLVILVTHTQEVHNRIIVPGREYSGSELIEVANYLNDKFAGLDMRQIHVRMLEELKKVQQDMNQLMLDAISLGEKIFAGEEETADDYVLAGETSLMGYDELSDIKRLRHLFEAFHQKRDILSILDQCITAEGVKIFIGHESGAEVLNDCSVISAPYEHNGEVVGVLGVIGPTRMAYDRVIPVVDITAKLLTAALNSKD